MDMIIVVVEVVLEDAVVKFAYKINYISCIISQTVRDTHDMRDTNYVY
jgi:hypothetical protein